MAELLNNLTVNKMYTFLVPDIIQILIIFFVLYYIVKSIRHTRAWILAKGIIVVFIVYAIVSLLKLNTIEYIMQQIFQLITIAIIIMFQPELQKLFESLGKQDFRTWYNKLKRDKNSEFQLLNDKSIDEIVKGCERMASVKTGVLIVIERDIPLTSVIDSGIDINADITAELLINIFEKNTPLHDGAVVIKNNKVRAATCYLPLSKNEDIQKSLGTRHRAGIGISENTDALVIIVSEETGEISFCENGKINHGISPELLKKKLQVVGNKPTAEQEKTKHIVLNKNKLSIKIIIAIISIFIWVSITDSQDAVVTTTINDVPVTINNDSIMDSIGQTYNVVSGETVDVEITGRRSLVYNINKNDIIAIADFRKMSQVYSVPIEVKTRTYNDELSIKTTENDVMILKLEDIMEKEVPVELKVEGVSKGNSYIVVDEVEYDKIKISAPETKVKNISKAVITVNVNNKDTDFVTFVTPVLLDSNNKEVDMNGVNMTTESVKVSMKAYKTKEVPLILNAFSSSEDERYDIVEYTFDKDNVTIAGDEYILNEIENITIDLDLTTSNDLASAIIVDVEQYIPDNIYIVNEYDKQINLKVSVNKYVHRTIQISKDDIIIKGLDNKKKINIIEYPTVIDYFVVSTIDDIGVEEFNPTLNIKNNAVGEYTETLSLTAIEGVTLEGEHNVKYEITKK